MAKLICQQSLLKSSWSFRKNYEMIHCSINISHALINVFTVTFHLECRIQVIKIINFGIFSRLFWTFQFVTNNATKILFQIQTFIASDIRNLVWAVQKIQINTDTHVKQFPNEALYTMYIFFLFCHFVNKTLSCRISWKKAEPKKNE